MTKKQELKKHSSAIHTDGKLSLLERKLSNVLLYNAYDELLTNRVHHINVHVLAEVSGFNSNNIGALKKAIRNLRQVSIEWDILKEDGTKKWGTSSLLASVEIDNGICAYEYSSALAEKLATPELYGIINLEIQKNFTSSYSLIVYEICSRFKGLLSKRNHCYTHWYSLSQFKKFLGVEDSSYYGEFKQLNAKIIKPAINEINGSLKKYIGTDIHIEPEFKKAKRTVSDIRFKITSNKQAAPTLGNDENDVIRKTVHYIQLLEHGMSDKGAIHVIKTTDSETLTQNIQATKQAAEAGTIRTSVSGFLAQAIKDDYRPKVTQTETQKLEEEKKKELKAQQAFLEETKTAQDKARRIHSKAIRSEYVASLSIQGQEELLEKLREDKPFAIQRLIKSLESPQIASEINDMIPSFDEKLNDMMMS